MVTVGENFAPQVAAQEPSPVIDAAAPSPLKQIRTYQGDVAEALRNQEESLVSIRAAEKARQELIQKASPAMGTTASPAAHRNWVTPILFITSIILLGAAGVGAWFSYQTYLEKTAVPTTTIPDNRFLPVAGSTDIDASSLSREGLIALAQTDRETPPPDGNVRHLVLRKGNLDTSPLTTTTEFLLLLGTRAPASLVRAFDPLFMFGTLGLPAQAGEAPASTVLLVKLDSYENSFAGMLEWERTLKEDLVPVFVSRDELAQVPADAAFTDMTIRNKDVRVLHDANGKSALVYTFYNQSLLLVASREDALRTLIAVLDAQALTR